MKKKAEKKRQHGVMGRYVKAREGVSLTLSMQLFKPAISASSGMVNEV